MGNASSWEDPPGGGAGQRQAPGAGQQAQSGWRVQPGQQTPPGQPDPGIPAQRAYEAEAGGRELAGQQHHGFAHGLARGPFSGFIPWILYWVIGGPSTWETGAIAALLAALLLTVLSIERRPLLGSLINGAAPPAGRADGQQPGGWLDFRRLKVLDVATVVFFAALVIAAIVTPRHDSASFDKYAQALSSGVLGLIALGSILVGHPFTIDYAKEQAPERVWHTAVFKRINLVLTAVWTVVFLVCAGLGLLALHVSGKGLQDWLNWYIPIALIVLGVRLNTWYPNYVRGRLPTFPDGADPA